MADIEAVIRSEDFEANFDYYCSQHRTVGCKVTHMIGVPLILLTPFIALVNLRLALRIFFLGWGLQFLGHYGFEHNEPVFLELRSPLTIVSALVFVGKCWNRLFTGKSLETGTLPH